MNSNDARFEKTTYTGKTAEFDYSFSAMQGLRNEMEDGHTLIEDIEYLHGWSFFAVYDGHGGTKASAYCSRFLLDNILKTEFFQKLRDVARKRPSEKCVNYHYQEVEEALKAGFLNMDNQLRATPDFNDKSGTTVVAALLTPVHVFIANCGDSRAILVRDRQIEIATCDHKPVNIQERERIQNAGGMVVFQRVNGGLATSRGLGDFEYKNNADLDPDQQYVSPVPDIYRCERSPAKDNFLALACDGIWDVMSNEAVQNDLQAMLNDDRKLSYITERLLDNCLQKGSRDNMSVILLRFKTGK